MRKITFGLVVALGALAGCGGDPSEQELCNDLVQATCGKLYECIDPAQLEAAGYPATEDECVDKESASCDTENACEAGQTLNIDTAQDCIDGINSSSCSDIEMGETPASCEQACEE